MFWNYLVSSKNLHHPKAATSQGGFGLVELMVSITVMVIVSSIILVRQSSFNSAVLLRGQAYEIALQAREVQLSAVGAINNDGSGTFRSVLGLHFDYANSNDGKYRIFRDADSDHYYDSAEIFGEQGILDSRFEIRDIRVGGNPLPSGGTELSVVFERPNFDAHFYNASNNELNVEKAEITISQRGVTGSTCGSEIRVVEITKTGQIAVQDCP